MPRGREGGGGAAPDDEKKNSEILSRQKRAFEKGKRIKLSSSSNVRTATPVGGGGGSCGTTLSKKGEKGGKKGYFSIKIRRIIYFNRTQEKKLIEKKKHPAKCPSRKRKGQRGRFGR